MSDTERRYRQRDAERRFTDRSAIGDVGAEESSNQVSTSTLRLSVAESAPLVRAGRFAFGESFARAGADLLNVSAAILHGSIRVFGVLVPFCLVVGPGTLLLRALLRRMRRAPAG